MVKVKICGLSTIASVIAADEADYAGFVVGSPRSHRNISISKFLQLREHLSHAQPVLVTVNNSLKFLHRLHKFEGVIIQLHGKARSFANMLSKSSLGLNFEEYIGKKYDFLQPYQFLSIDSTTKDGYGGTGETWEWKNVRKNTNHPVLVAGGIDFNNVEEAIELTNADGIDVSSSVEINKKKSLELIQDFITLVRGIQ